MVYFFIWGDIKGLNAEQIVTKAGQHIEESIGGAAQK